MLSNAAQLIQTLVVVYAPFVISNLYTLFHLCKYQAVSVQANQLGQVQTDNQEILLEYTRDHVKLYTSYTFHAMVGTVQCT